MSSSQFLKIALIAFIASKLPDGEGPSGWEMLGKRAHFFDPGPTSNKQSASPSPVSGLGYTCDLGTYMSLKMKCLYVY